MYEQMGWIIIGLGNTPIRRQPIAFINADLSKLDP